MSNSTGAKWIRAALQVNPYGYKGRNAPSTVFSSEEEYNTAILDECGRLGIRMIAITDHWCVESGLQLIEAASARGIVALPGFEANSSEGVHILVIFEAGTSPADVNAAIGICGSSPGSTGAGDCGFSKIIEEMTRRGALVIPAHVNCAPSGLLERTSGQPLQKMVTHSDVHVLGITPSELDSTNQEAILANRKPFKRLHPLAAIHADDIMKPSDLAKPGGTSWFKVSSECQNSLKLAVRTPMTRVSFTDPTSTPRVLIREITWVGGFLDGITIPISEELTALIGGRGTGKSTVIESLRYALDIDPIGKEATADHKAIVKDVLKSGTIIKVTIETPRPAPHRYTIERVVNEPPVVKDASGTPTSQRPEDLIPRVEIFGQHELAELSTDPARVAKMLQRFTGSDGPDEKQQGTLTDLQDNREQLKKLEDLAGVLEEELSAAPRLEEQIKQYDTTQVPTKLAAQQRLGQDEAVLSEARTRVTNTRTSIQALTDSQLSTGLLAPYDSGEESPQQTYLDQASAATAELAARMSDLAAQALAAVDQAESAIAAAKAEWEVSVTAQRDEYNEVLRILHEQGLEPDKYVDTQRALETVKAKEPRLKQIQQSIFELKTDRVALLAQLTGHEQRQVEELHDAVRAANAVTSGVVIVQPVPAPERKRIKEAFSDHVPGNKTSITAAVEVSDFSTRSFVAAARKGPVGLSTYGIKGMQAANIVAAGEPLFRRLEELNVGLAVDVRLNIAFGSGTREYRSMSQLSKGQKATALLLLLLSGSDAPLVIDQPEDDLDNRFVYDGVVTNLRNLKGKRQIITSTHNANVPVLGDAEQIIALEGDGQHGWPTKDGIGSLDDEKIRSLAENILEGGPDAFNARQHLYGF